MIQVALERAMKLRGLALIVVGLAFGAGCASGERDENYSHWEVAAVGVADECNIPPQSFSQQMTYALAFEGSSTSLSLFEEGDYNGFAAGVLGGCRLVYESSVYKEERGDSEDAYIQWKLSGEAFFQLDGGGCDIEARLNEILYVLPSEGAGGREWETLEIDYPPRDLDWVGTETFEIVGVGSAIEGIEPGCTYEVLTAGVHSP